MAEERTTKKAKADANVLASLPATRPNRLGRRGRDGAGTTERAAAGTRAKPTATKAAGAATKAKGKATAATKAKAARKAPARKKPAAEPVASVAKATPQRPKPIRSASDSLAAPARKGNGQRQVAPPDKAPSGTELVTTVVQAAGELASVGLSIGGQIVKRAVDKLPKP